jgi:A/G-specific adenine glycosylase
MPRAGHGYGDPGGTNPGAEEIRTFRERILAYYQEYGREFPWRDTRDPWAILVSEVMLQQTQTDRVTPKYIAWMASYPTPEALSRAPLAEVLGLWSGLGYNRRALALVRAATRIAAAGEFPDDEDSLLELPGVGPYTARAVLAFAYEKPVILIETNIRSVFLHCFLADEEGVSDARIAKLVEATLVREDPRRWYYALMDYGVMLKRSVGNPNLRSAHYARQSPFADSNRRIRGALLKELGQRGRADADELSLALPVARERVERALGELKAEGFVAESCGVYRLGE